MCVCGGWIQIQTATTGGPGNCNYQQCGLCTGLCAVPPKQSHSQPWRRLLNARVYTHTMTAASKLIQASIRSIWQETPTVKGLQLAVEAAGSMSFQPGQWVDFHAPGVTSVGGYSICSTPQQLQRSGTFELCVKASRHPCAQWVHQQAAPGDKVGVQVGGTFTLAPSSSSRPCLFVAGGIGITCLSSMLEQLVVEQQEAMGNRQQAPPPMAGSRLLLLYSAATPEEFALLPRLLAWQQRGLLQLQLYTTQRHGPVPDAVQQLPRPQDVCMQRSRIDKGQLQQAVGSLQGQKGLDAHVDAYVCGPPAMTDAVTALLTEVGLPGDCIRTEKWW